MTSLSCPVTSSREFLTKIQKFSNFNEGFKKMDILEQHLDHQDVSATNPKEDEATGIVIEEAEIVDCDADDPLSGDGVDDDGLRYQETLAYRVVHVNETDEQDIDIASNQQTNNAVQVLSSPINGQFYVIGNANDVFTTAQTSRSMSPRTTTIQIETPRNSGGGVKKRDDRRRATHNEVERRRRDKINNWIAKLGKIIPECAPSGNSAATNGNSSSGEGKSNYETQSKGGILAKACEYIGELRAANQGMGQCLRENEKLRQEVATLKQIIAQLKRDNSQLRSSAAAPNIQVSEFARLKS